MKKLLIVLIFSQFFLPFLPAQIVLKKPLSSRTTYYKMNAKLDVQTKIVYCEMDSYWINKSNEVVPDIQLHMYLNAFSGSRSTFYSESGGNPGLKESDWGWIDIKKLTDKNRTDLIPLMKYISPDDGNSDDRTVLRINLPKPVNPGDTVFLRMSFESKLPSKIIRTGYSDDFFFVAQWFPKFGVYEPAGMRYAVKGAWNCHQFHSNSEFYSDHSVYDVTITVPKDFVIGTGGLQLDEKESGNGNKIITCRAEDIVDFAWTAWPGYAVYTDQWKNVKISLLSPPERKNQVMRQFQAVKNALEYLEENVGPYPWPYLTFVDPPLKAVGASGMEYTTLFTSFSFTMMPDFMHFMESATIHEFGHAYFMGILASNEFEEPWLDEGVNQFWEVRIVDNYYGKNSGILDLPFFKIADRSLSRTSYSASASRQVASNKEYSWNYPHDTYGMMSYMKPVTWLYTLMGIVGEETTNEIFREYYRKWSFKHPSGKDFVDVVNDVVKRIHGNKYGADMNWFFDQTLYGTGICDYKVSGFTNTRIEAPIGRNDMVDSIDNKLFSGDSLFKSVVQLERIGDIMLPVEIQIHFNNGNEINETWDGKSRFKDFTYSGTRKILWVKIDPEYKIAIDVNWVNNSKTDKPDPVPLKRMISKLITFLQFLVSIVSL